MSFYLSPYYHCRSRMNFSSRRINQDLGCLSIRYTPPKVHGPSFGLVEIPSSIPDVVEEPSSASHIASSLPQATPANLLISGGLRGSDRSRKAHSINTFPERDQRRGCTYFDGHRGFMHSLLSLACNDLRCSRIDIGLPFESLPPFDTVVVHSTNVCYLIYFSNSFQIPA